MFVKGQVYQRKEIHETYGGQKHGIISTPQKQSFVLIFSDSSIEGDGVNTEGEYLLTGEGKTGDMKFVRGNKAIRDHVKDGKKLYLFKLAENQGEVEFIGEAIYKDFETKKGPDKDGNERECIVMKLGLVDDEHITTEENIVETVEEINEKIVEEKIEESQEEVTEEKVEELVEDKIEESNEVEDEKNVEKPKSGLKEKLSAFFSRFK